MRWNAYKLLTTNEKIPEVKTRKKRENKECSFQIKLVNFFYPFGLPLLKIGNEGYYTKDGKPDKIRGKIQKMMGLIPGAPDLILLMPNKQYPAFLIELKDKGKKLSKTQKIFLEWMETFGFKTGCYDNLLDAQTAILEYINGVQYQKMPIELIAGKNPINDDDDFLRRA